MNDEMKCSSSDQTLPVVRKPNQNLGKCVEAVGRDLVYQMKALHEVSSQHEWEILVQELTVATHPVRYVLSDEIANGNTSRTSRIHVRMRRMWQHLSVQGRDQAHAKLLLLQARP